MTEPAPYQGMSASVMAELLALIQAYDKTFVPDELDVSAYRQVAMTYRWTHHEATTAIHAWGGDHPEGQRLDASLLNRLIRNTRQDQMSRAAAPTGAAIGDSRDGTGYPVGDDPAWGRNNSADLEQVHREAIVVACPQCHQGIEERCKNTLTGNATKIPHPKRMKAAGIGSPSRLVNRRAVLKHPDLLAELRKRPCAFTNPEGWGGYLPPDRDEYGRRNTSPYRAQLVAIVEEAQRREAS